MRRGKPAPTEDIWLLSGEMIKVIQPHSSDKYLEILEEDGIKQHGGKDNQKVPESIGFKAECQKHNFGNEVVRSRSSSVCCWNPEVSRGGAKGDGQRLKKASNDARSPLYTYRHWSPIYEGIKCRRETEVWKTACLLNMRA